jgi:hypothetical protein
MMICPACDREECTCGDDSPAHGMRIPLPTREEMLAMDLPFEWHGVSRVGDQILGKVVYRHPTAEARDNFLKAEARALKRK